MDSRLRDNEPAGEVSKSRLGRPRLESGHKLADLGLVAHLPRRVQAAALAVLWQSRGDKGSPWQPDVPEHLHVLAMTQSGAPTGRAGTLAPPQTVESSIRYAEALVGNLRPERLTTSPDKVRLHERLVVEVRRIRRYAQRVRQLAD